MIAVNAEQIGWACLILMIGAFLLYLIGRNPDDREDEEEFKRRLR